MTALQVIAVVFATAGAALMARLMADDMYTGDSDTAGAEEALAVHLSHLYGEAETLQAELWDATCNCHDQWNLDYIQGEIDSIMVIISPPDNLTLM